MAIHDIWLNNLKALVETEGGGDRRKGLRAVADLAGISEEYVYQLVEGKPKKDGAPRQVGKVAAKKIAIAFANGRPESWFDTASGHVNAANLYETYRQQTRMDSVGQWTHSKTPVLTSTKPLKRLHGAYQ